MSASQRRILELERQLARKEDELNAWVDIAAMEHRNCEFWRGLVHRCGDAFGIQARTCDDGSISDSVLGLKVPELVEAMVAANANPYARFLARIRTMFTFNKGATA